MKKGDIRKQEILNTAEQLFCRNGYEQTSIQNILDFLNISKGSFYHHFVSKEALLEGICRKRAVQIFNAVSCNIHEDMECAESIDTILSGMIPFRDEKLSFLLMLLPVFHMSEGKSVRIGYCEALSEQFLPMLSDVLLAGKDNGEIVCLQPNTTAELILSIINWLWIKICTAFLCAEENGTEADLSDLLITANVCRITIERLISLPFGSLKLIDIPTLKYLSEQIHNHWSS